MKQFLGRTHRRTSVPERCGNCVGSGIIQGVFALKRLNLVLQRLQLKTALQRHPLAYHFSLRSRLFPKLSYVTVVQTTLKREKVKSETVGGGKASKGLNRRSDDSFLHL